MLKVYIELPGEIFKHAGVIFETKQVFEKSRYFKRAKKNG